MYKLEREGMSKCKIFTKLLLVLQFKIEGLWNSRKNITM